MVKIFKKIMNKSKELQELKKELKKLEERGWHTNMIIQDKKYILSEKIKILKEGLKNEK